MKKILISVAITLGFSLAFPGSNAQALIGDVYDETDSVKIDLCFGKAYGNSIARLEITDGQRPWTPAENTTTLASAVNSRFVVDASGCVLDEVFKPALYAASTDREVAYRLVIPAQTSKGKKRKARSRPLGNFKVWNWRDARSSDPVPHLNAFGTKYGEHVATVLCFNPFTGRGGQGSGFAVPVNLDPSALALNAGNTYLVTAGHVVEDCFFQNYTDLTVIYKGQSYPAKTYSSWEDPDIGAIMTTAPIPPVRLATGPSSRPVVGDAGISIGVAGGVPGTTTQGQVVGVIDAQLNTTIPSGPGASGGPVFNNQGAVIGFIIAGSGSLTIATALPVFCGTVYVADPCSARW